MQRIIKTLVVLFSMLPFCLGFIAGLIWYAAMSGVINYRSFVQGLNDE